MIYLMMLFSLTAFATFIPQNEIKVYPPKGVIGQISEAEFNQRAEKIRAVYAPHIKSLKGKLKLKADWKNDKLNARATQFFGSWIVEFTGGVARHPELTGDGMSLIICHELGHHLGGFPFDGGSPIGGNWAATEGQSDYYSTHVCARKLWSSEKEINQTYAETASLPVKEKCERLFQDQEERNLCYRIGMGSVSVAKTMAAIMGKPAPQIETPDTTVRETTLLTHPKIQCRLDTLFQGTICAAPHDYMLIPGKNVRHKESLEAEKESAAHVCSAMTRFTEGLRPACWFKARL